MIKYFQNQQGKQFAMLVVPDGRNIIPDKNHNHYWFGMGVFYESYNTIRGLRYREIFDTGDENIDFHGEHRFIGLSPSLTEEQWKDIVVEPKDDSPLWWIGRLLLDSFGFKISDNVLILEVTS